MRDISHSLNETQAQLITHKTDNLSASIDPKFQLQSQITVPLPQIMLSLVWVLN